MSRILDDFLKSAKGRMIYVVLRSEQWLMMTAIDSIISFEIRYTNLNLVEVVA